MIVRENESAFILIEQDYHAKMSAAIMENWKDSWFLGKERRKSVEFAIEYHDCGWKQFDKQPFWNDEKLAPYTFSDFPISSKMIVYTHGIDEVEKQDPYASLLCSIHFSKFLINDDAEDAISFVHQEKKRQKRIMKNLEEINKKHIQFHYELLRLGDNLSLYLCLNEPGIPKEKEHHFFRNGIPLPSGLNEWSQTVLDLNWLDPQTVSVHPFPFNHSMTVKVKQKVLDKASIHTNGLIKCYECTPFEGLEIQLIPY